MSDLVIKQARFYEGERCHDAIQEVEERYTYRDEMDYFSHLVNFSTAKSEPFQRWVRYREGYSTALVNELIQRSGIHAGSHFVADPMVGSGSTVISAKKSGFDAFGVDVNPYCKVIADAKLLAPTDEDITVVKRFLAELPQGYSEYGGPVPPLADYFPPENLISLMGLKDRILSVENQNARQMLLSCWYFILEQCSNRKKDGNGLATRPAPVHDVISFFRETMGEILTDYVQHPLPSNTHSRVFTGSACEFSAFSDAFSKQTQKRLGAIIFSPPYANAFDYYESYKIELLFGQLYLPDDYQLHKKEQIRNYRISYGRELHCEHPLVERLCEEINFSIPKKERKTGKRDARTRLMPNMLRGYFTDMGVVFEQLYASLDDGGHCYIVVDQSAYVGVIVPTDVLLAEIAERKGFTVNHIIICRAAATSGQQRSAYPYLGSTLRESIVCLQK